MTDGSRIALRRPGVEKDQSASGMAQARGRRPGDVISRRSTCRHPSFSAFKLQGIMPRSISTSHHPPGFTLRHTLHGHDKVITRLSWAPDGTRLASAGQDGTIRIWDTVSGKLTRKLTVPGVVRLGQYWLTEHLQSAIAWRPAWSEDGRSIICGYGDSLIRIWNTRSGDIERTLESHTAKVNNVVFSPDYSTLASGADDNTVILWNVDSYTPAKVLTGHQGGVNNVAWHPKGRLLASGSLDGTVRIWDVQTLESIAILFGHEEKVITVTWSPDGNMLASSSGDNTIRLWEPESGVQCNILESHCAPVSCIAFSFDGKYLASKSNYPDSTVRIWRTATWDTVASLHEPSRLMWFAGLAFHPGKLTLATLAERDTAVRIWDIDESALEKSAEESDSTKYCTARIVLLGDSGAGKTGLGWRLANGFFTEQPSTHGQQFWVADELGGKREDGVECEAILWDLAGQPDYRLVHSLFLEDVDLGLLVFDPTERDRPLSGIDYWLRQVLYGHEENLPAILVGARIDRGSPTYTEDDLQEYCRSKSITGGYIGTSAKTGEGIRTLIKKIKSQIDWAKLPATITSGKLRAIRQYILSLKHDKSWKQILVTPKALRDHIVEARPDSGVSINDIISSAKYMQNHGYTRLIEDHVGDVHILLSPDLAANLASSIVLEARRHAEGVGAVDEDKIIRGEIELPEVRGLAKKEKDILTYFAVNALLRGNICFREVVRSETLLVFPSLINQRPKPSDGDDFREDGLYVITGATENLYAYIVVMLRYTDMFSSVKCWQNEAQFTMGNDQICGFRQMAEREGTIEIMLRYGHDTPNHIKLLFRGLFEKFLDDKNVSAIRYPVSACPKCNEPQEKTVLSKQLLRGLTFVFCPYCGQQIFILQSEEFTGLPLSKHKQLMTQKLVASRRKAYDSALVWIKSNTRPQTAGSLKKVCFLSYARGVPEHEKWMLRLARDLQNSGLEVLLDQWHNPPGASIVKFTERISSVDFVLAIGTPAYRKKYETEEGGHVVDAELRLIGTRLRKRREEQERVIPLLLAGDQSSSFPPSLEDSVFIDFRVESQYFVKLFDLVVTIYRIPFDQAGLDDIRGTLEAISY